MIRPGLFLAALVLTLAPALAAADTVPVLAVRIAGRAPTTAALRDALIRVGSTAETGAALASRLEARFGRALPPGDPLAPARERVERGMQLYYQGPQRFAQAEALLREASESLAADGALLASREDNRAAHVRATFGRVRIALERRQAEAAWSLLRALAEREPALVPDEREVPPNVVALFHRAAAAVAATPRAEVRVEVVGGATCTAWLDGRAVGTVPVVARGLAPGAHHVAVECDGARSRWHAVTVAANAAAVVLVNAGVESRVETDDGGALVYRAMEQARVGLVGDLATLGEALGARYVVGVLPEQGSAGMQRVVVDARARRAVESDGALRAAGLEGLAGAATRDERAARAAETRGDGRYVAGLHPVTLVFGSAMVVGIGGGLVAEGMARAATPGQAAGVRAVEYMAFGFAGACLLGTALTAWVLREGNEHAPASARVAVVPTAGGAEVSVGGVF